VKREVEPYREMSDDEKAEIIRSLFRASVRLMEARDDAYDVLEHRDRLPESSLRLLAHLRALRRERRKHDDHHE
jgi:hypothetical protein